MNIAFDFDNTLIDSSNSDYEIYRLTCVNIGVCPLCFVDYIQIRKSGKLIELLNSSGVNSELFFSVRSIVALDESLMRNDELIVDLNLLAAVKNIYQIYLVTKRRDLSEVVYQCNALSLPIDQENIFVTGPDGRKEDIFKKYNFDLYVGDSRADEQSCIAAGLTFMRVDTGFDRVSTARNSYANVNYFLLQMLKKVQFS
jgi:phosphoglycolate phosphatase-like HAD superfamily hydrolase